MGNNPTAYCFYGTIIHHDEGDAPWRREDEEFDDESCFDRMLGTAELEYAARSKARQELDISILGFSYESGSHALIVTSTLLRAHEGEAKGIGFEVRTDQMEATRKLWEVAEKLGIPRAMLSHAGWWFAVKWS